MFQLSVETVSDKVLKDRAYEITQNSQYDEYQRGLESMAFRFFIRKQDQVWIWKKEKKCMQHLL